MVGQAVLPKGSAKGRAAAADPQQAAAEGRAAAAVPPAASQDAGRCSGAGVPGGPGRGVSGAAAAAGRLALPRPPGRRVGTGRGTGGRRRAIRWRVVQCLLKEGTRLVQAVVLSPSPPSCVKFVFVVVPIRFQRSDDGLLTRSSC